MRSCDHQGCSWECVEQHRRNRNSTVHTAPCCQTRCGWPRQSPGSSNIGRQGRPAQVFPENRQYLCKQQYYAVHTPSVGSFPSGYWPNIASHLWLNFSRCRRSMASVVPRAYNPVLICSCGVGCQLLGYKQLMCSSKLLRR